MADKKISQLPDKTGGVLGTDILPLVANTAQTPTNYKVSIKNLLGSVQIDLPQTNAAAFGLSATVSNTVSATLAVAQFNLLTGNSATGSGNTFGMLVNHAYPIGANKRGVAPRAFIGLLDAPGTGGLATTFLMDVGALGSTVSANTSAANTSVMLTVPTGNRAATHMVKFSINGQTLWFLCANTVTGA